MKVSLIWALRVLWIVLCFGAFELSSAFWLHTRGDALDQTRAIVWADSQLGWRQRPSLNTEFLGQPLRTNELGLRAPSLEEIKEARRKILVLGPSSAFGWGVKEEDTYSQQLQALLRVQAMKDGGEAPLVINAGEIGFSSYQGRKLLEELQSLKPELVLLAYGVNDVDRHRFYFQSNLPDREELAVKKDELQSEGFRLLARSRLLSLLYKLANQVRASWAWEAPSLASPVPALRVAPEDFKTNLRALIEAAKLQGTKVVILGTPVNMPTIPPAKEISALWNAGVERFSRKEWSQALVAFLAVSVADPNHNETYYYLHAIASQLGRSREAAEFLERARATEPYRIHRDVRAYNELAREVALAESISFVDLNGIFESLDRKAAFVDPVHPSAMGHKLIAWEIWRSVWKKGN